MINFIHEKKIKNFKKNNSLLVKVLLSGLLILSPLIFFIAPIPFYLLTESNEPRATLLAIFLFLTFIGIDLKVYWSFWSRQQIFYIIHTLPIRYLNQQFISSCLTKTYFFHFFLFAGFIKVGFNIFSIVVGMFLYCVCILLIHCSYKLKVHNFLFRSVTDQFHLTIKLVYLCFRRAVLIRGCLIILVLVMSLAFQYSSIDKSLLPFYLTLFFALIIFLFISIKKTAMGNLAEIQSFLIYICPNAERKYRSIITRILVIAFLISIYINYMRLVF
jgi:hypothetical protein